MTKPSLNIVFVVYAVAVASCGGIEGEIDPALFEDATQLEQALVLEAGCYASDSPSDYYYESFTDIRPTTVFPTHSRTSCKDATIIDVHTPVCSPDEVMPGKPCTVTVIATATDSIENLRGLRYPFPDPKNFDDCQSLSFRYHYFQWRRPPEGGARRWLWSGFGGGYGGWNTNTNRCEARYSNTAGPFSPYDTRFVIGLVYKGERYPFMLGGHISY